MVFVETIINFMLVVEVTVGIVAQGRVRLSQRGGGSLPAPCSTLALRCGAQEYWRSWMNIIDFVITGCCVAFFVGLVQVNSSASEASPRAFPGLLPASLAPPRQQTAGLAPPQQDDLTYMDNVFVALRYCFQISRLLSLAYRCALVAWAAR